ncbi:MAG: hypothetical protein WCC39_09625 [Telluria sp.]
MAIDLKEERLASYYRLRGGFPVPLAGAVWWAALAYAGYAGLKPQSWMFAAAVSSGLIFPLALFFAKVFRCDFMKDRTAATSVLAPTFISMSLFWPIAISAWWSFPPLFPLVLAIGMSLHWPVIGWTYGRAGLFSGHAIVRAVVCFYIWNWMPKAQLTLLPASVAAIYLVTVIIILIDSARIPKRADNIAKSDLPAV